MAQTSTLAIDGREITGTGLQIMSAYVAVLKALGSLSDRPRELAFPLTGTTDDGQRVVQVFRLHAASALYVSIVEDGTFGNDFVDLMGERHAEFMRNFGPGNTTDEPVDIESTVA